MTNTETMQDDTTTAATGPFPAVVEISPVEVEIGTNVRVDARLDRAFIASVRERGVIVPVVAYRNNEGVVVVIDGQRRTLAAIEAGLIEIPAYVAPAREDVDRIIDQIAANDHRTALTTSERAAAFEQLAAIGLSAGQIAKRTATKRAQVDAGLAAAASPAATEAMGKHAELTLDQAAALTEFDTDAEAVTRLLKALPGGQFEHTVQRIRDERAEAEATELLVEALTAQGVRVIERPGYDDRKCARLSHLKGSTKGSELTAEEHASCDGNAAYVERAFRGDDLVTPVYVCTAWRKYGHTERYGTSSSAKPAVADMTDDEREKARAQRRDVIESNKAWKSAETVRRAWVAAFLTRKTAPKGTAAFIASAMFYDSHGLNSVDSSQLVEDFIGIRGGYSDPKAQATIDTATEGRATVIALGYALAAHEAKTGTHSWREVSKNTARYLVFLAANGYELSPVEHRAAGTKPAKKSTKTPTEQKK